MKKILTIFTPAYNRGYTIYKFYESLKKQSNKSFIWLVIDDGSIDNTKELILKWKKEADFEIRYIYKENGGMHTAHNLAYEVIDTELNVCIDSDDYMTDDAVDTIIKAWEEVRSEDLAGIGALNVFESGEVIGIKFPENLNRAKYFDIYHKHGVHGDKKFIYRSDLTREFPYPEFVDERYVGLDYKYKKIDEKYEMYLLNKVVCVVEYMADGSSKNMLKQYRNNPKGWRFYRLENLKIQNTSINYKFKECIHYIASSFILKKYSFLKELPNKILGVLAIPFGIGLYGYILKNTMEK